MAKVKSGLQMTLSWVPIHGQDIPQNAMCAGDNVYVARGMVNGQMCPGKLVHGHHNIYVPFGGQEVSVNQNAEVLCVTGQGPGPFYKWEFGANGSIPEKAVCAGIASDGQPLFVARSRVQNEVVVGKVHMGHNTAYMPWGGKECPVSEYEVLVWRKEAYD